MNSVSLRKLRSRKKAQFTRLCKRADTLIDISGSRCQIEALLKELDEALDSVSEANDSYTDSLKEDDCENDQSEEYMINIEQAHQKICERIREHLEARKDADPSEPETNKTTSKSQSAVSKLSNRSAASKEAEIGASLKQMELRQLELRITGEHLLSAQL